MFHLGAVGVDSLGNVTAAGGFSSSLVFGNTTLQGKGGVDIYVVKYSVSGDPLWARGFGSTGGTYGDGGLEEALGCAVDRDGNAIVTGNFWYPVSFDNTTLNSIGNYDMFLAKLAP